LDISEVTLLSDEKFQVIVVGAGVAGCAAAYRLAKAGREVLLVDRAKTAGAKNVTGGRLYTYALEELMPGEWADAPLEREITREIVMMMANGNGVALDSRLTGVDRLSYSVLRAKLDAWLAAKAEEAGAMVVTGSTVDELMVRDGKVCGVRLGDEELEADLVISAEGVNALTAERSGLITPVKVENVAVGVKQVFKLPEAVINERFNTVSGKGAAMMCVGECTKGVSGGAFLYTNKESISLGIVVDSQSWKNAKLPLADMTEELNQHPALAGYLEGGELVEYSAHLIPEGGIHAVPRFAADGFMIVGDAAGLVVNNGLTVRGMDYAILSGIAAADTANEAIEANAYGAAALKGYETRLRQRVLKDLEIYKNSHSFMVEATNIFTVYPGIAADMMRNIYAIDGRPARRLTGIAKETLAGRLSLFEMAKDAFKAVKSL
jgi:electron transfer flavoprotein-quinone oxidoreductase